MERRVQPDRYSHGRQLLWEAIGGLVGGGSVQERLGCALHPLQRAANANLPDDLAARLRTVLKELANKRTETYGVDRSLRIKVTTATGDRIAKEVLSIFVSLQGGL